MLLNCGVGEDSVKSPLDCKIKQSTLKEINPECSLGRTDAEAKAPILWPPDVKNWLTGKDPDAGKDWRQEKGMTEVEIAGWHHWLNGHEFEQAPGDGKGQGSLACFLGVVVHGVAKNWIWLSDWTTICLNTCCFFLPVDLITLFLITCIIWLFFYTSIAFTSSALFFFAVPCSMWDLPDQELNLCPLNHLELDMEQQTCSK